MRSRDNSGASPKQLRYRYGGPARSPELFSKTIPSAIVLAFALSSWRTAYKVATFRTEADYNDGRRPPLTRDGGGGYQRRISRSTAVMDQ